MEFSRQTLVGAVFIGSVLLIDGFLLVEERSEPEGMMWVEAGSYSAETGNSPPDKAEISGFWIDAEAITEQQFHRFVEETEYLSNMESAQQDRRYDYRLPIELADQGQAVSHKFHLAHEDAKAYCHWLRKKVSSKLQAEHAGLEAEYAGFHCVKPHRSNDLATLWLKD